MCIYTRVWWLKNFFWDRQREALHGSVFCKVKLLSQLWLAGLCWDWDWIFRGAESCIHARVTLIGTFTHPQCPPCSFCNKRCQEEPWNEMKIMKITKKLQVGDHYHFDGLDFSVKVGVSWRLICIWSGFERGYVFSSDIMRNPNEIYEHRWEQMQKLDG